MAGTAIRSARAIRWRRLVTVAVASAVAAVMVACVRPAPPGSPTPSGGAGDFGTVPVISPAPANQTPTSPTPTSPYGVALDVLNPADQLLTTDGRRYDLSGQRIRYLERVPAGWLFGRRDEDRSWLLRVDGTTVALRAIASSNSGEQPGRPVVSADGTRIAWVTGGQAYAGRLTPDGEQDVVASPVDGDVFAATWIGPRVVLGQSYGPGCCGYRHAQYDVWDPAQGDFAPHWTKGLSPVYGPVPDGVAAFAIQQVGDLSTSGCLIRLDGVTDLSATAKACVPGLHYGSLQGSLGPDGRHLLEGGDGTAVVFDLTTVLDTASTSGRCRTGPVAAWESGTSVLIAGGAGLIRCDVVSGAVTFLDQPLGPGPTQARVVPRRVPAA